VGDKRVWVFVFDDHAAVHRVGPPGGYRDVVMALLEADLRSSSELL
jgi:hypothetical protein